MIQNKNKQRLITPGYVLTFVLVTALFFLWSWPNTLNDFLITQFKKSLELNMGQTGFLPFALKTGYFVLAIPAGLYMQRKGYKAGLLMGLTLFGAGCLLFYPAASTQKFVLFLGGIFVMAGGCAFLEIGANSFVVSLGDKATSERRLNLAQSFNPIGNILASTAATVFIFSGNEPDAAEIARMKATTLANGVNEYQAFLKEENFRVFPVYIALAAVVLIIALLLRRAKFPEAVLAKDADAATDNKGSFRTLLKYPHWMGAIVSQFFYLGAQLGTWSYLVLYITQNTALGEKAAGRFVIANMALFMAGRFFATWLMKYFRPTRLMGVYACINLCLISFAILGSKWGEARFGLGLNAITLPIPFTDLTAPLSIFALILTAFFMSLMYPTNFASGVKGLGPNTKLGASILMMSLIGGAISSLVISKLADTDWGLATGIDTPQIAAGMCIIAISYIVISWYAFFGAKPRGPIYE
jgi:FHS family L-fucose permease-like MFS transporter